MSLIALPVTSSDLTALQAGIAVFTDPAQATVVAGNITNQTPPGSSVFSYATQLFNAQSAGTQLAMAVDSLIQGGVPTAGPLLTPLGIGNELQNLTLATGQGGIQAAMKLAPTISAAIVPSVFAAESIAVGLASGGDGTQNNFTKLFGTQTTGQFAATVSAQTGVDATFVTTFINNWFSFYSGVGASAVQAGLTATTQAYAAAFGDAIGNALLAPQFNAGTKALSAALFNALVDNAEVIAGVPGAKYQPGVSLFAQTPHIPLQGEGAGGATVVLTLNPDNVGPGQNPPFKTIAGANNFIDAPLIGGQGTLQTADVIDGSAGGVNTIGRAGVPAWFRVAGGDTTQSPLVTNIQEIHAIGANNGGTLNFANVSQTAGQLKIAAISGTNSALDTNTTFSNLKLTTAVAVENFATTNNHNAEFKFTGATGVETADLTLNKAGVFVDLENNGGKSQANITINQIGTLNMHVTGNSGVDTLNSDTLATLNVDGTGNIRLDTAFGGAPNLKVVDATNLKGAFFYDGDSVTQLGITVKAGSGGSNIGTDGSSAERIFFDSAKVAGDTWTPEIFNNLVLLNQGAIDASGTLDLGSVWITNFQTGGLDKLDLKTNLAIPAANVFIADANLNVQAQTQLTLKLAAETVAVADGGKNVDVFSYDIGSGVNTYVFNDINGNNKVNPGDGFLKLVGVGANTIAANSFIA